MAGKNLIERTSEFIASGKLLVPGDRVLLSVSAGKDSMAMLHILERLAPVLGIEIGCFHLNHMTRGIESDLDEGFIAERSNSAGIPVFMRRHDFSGGPRGDLSFEEEARELRYRLLEETALSEGYTKIATAHTKSDNAETVLMRLFTGTGIHGLGGIPASRGIIIRPLLFATADDVYRYLADNGIRWRDDASNGECRYTRNYIRNEIIPAVRRRFPAFEEAIAGTGGIASEAVQLLDSMIRERYGDVFIRSGETVSVRCGPFADNIPMLRHVLASCLRNEFGLHPTRSILDEAARNFSQRRTHVPVYTGPMIRMIKTLAAGECVIVLSRGEPSRDDPGEWEVPVAPGAGDAVAVECPGTELILSASMEDVPFYRRFMNDRHVLCVDPGDRPRRMTLRNRRRGDRITLEHGSKKIKDFFIEKKLDTTAKNRVPLLVIDGEIAAVMTGFLFDIPNRVSSSFFVKEGSKKVLAITIKNHYTMDVEKPGSITPDHRLPDK